MQTGSQYKYLEIYLGLGSNLNDPIAQVKLAISALEEMQAVTLNQVSSFYLTEPWGEKNQPAFINAVAQLSTNLEPLELLACVQSIEHSQGRTRSGSQWGPRTLDIDILLYGRLSINLDNLIIPHARMYQRAFVLLPLLEVAGNIEIPGFGYIEALLAMCGKQTVRRLTDK